MKPFTISLLLFAATLSLSSAADRPNILFAFADDLGAYASAYRDPAHPSPCDVMSTPNFDRIVKEGALFLNAFVSSPSCTPSRTALLSGQHFYRNGSRSQLHAPWDKTTPDPFEQIKGYPLLLQDAGYHIGWSYKLDVRDDKMGGSSRNYKSAGIKFNNFSETVMAAPDREAAKKELYEEVRQNFRAFMADRKDKQPFYYSFNPTNAHRAWERGSGKALWGIEPDSLKGKLPPFLPDNEIVREDFADYLGEGQAFDAAIGVMLAELEAIGELDNTLVIVSGDHGAPGFPRGKTNLYDFGSQVLLGIRWPAKVVANLKVAPPVSLVDVAPTLLAAAGLPPAPGMNGQNLLPALAPDGDATKMLRGNAIIGRETHVDEAREGMLPYPMRAIRTGDYLYIVNFKPERWPVATPPLKTPGVDRRRTDLDFGPTRDFFEAHEGDPAIAEFWKLGFDKRPAEELYDLRKDRHQMTNLAANPEYGPAKEELRNQLMELLTQTEDPRVTGPDAFDQPPYLRTEPRKKKPAATE